MTPGPATGLVLGERYRLQDRIASGGMGTVWAAEDETLHRRVAVKVLNEGLSADERFTERFRREARAAAGLSHPAIAGVYDYGEEEGRPYIVMELIDGETLADRLRRTGPLPPEDVARIGATVSDALAYAHASGLVHRDVKPANIMLTKAGQVKVMDFGIAAPLEGSTGLTATGSIMGTSRYISPEQADGERAGPASDVYSLGVVLYEMLAGEPPFVRESSVATAMAHIHDSPPPLDDRHPAPPRPLAHLVHTCLAKDPSDRPAASTFAEELRSPGDEVVASTEPIPVGGDTEALHQDEIAAVVPPTEKIAPTPSRLRFPMPTLSPDRPRRDRRIRWLVGAALVAAGLVVFALVVSSNAGDVKVPRFIGLSRTEAKVRAVQLGLDPVFRAVDSDQVTGTVLTQRPHRGVAVPDGTPVVMQVSNGSAAATSPSPPPQPPPPKEHGKGKGNGKHKGEGKGKEKD